MKEESGAAVIKYASQWKEELLPVLDSKVEEFKLMGYNRADSADIWDCLVKKVWKGDPEKRLHQIVEDILHLSPGKYMSYLTVKVYQEDDDLMASIEALTGPAEE